MLAKQKTDIKEAYDFRRTLGVLKVIMTGHAVYIGVDVMVICLAETKLKADFTRYTGMSFPLLCSSEI
jgi:hypothetical protein